MVVDSSDKTARRTAVRALSLGHLRRRVSTARQIRDFCGHQLHGRTLSPGPDIAREARDVTMLCLSPGRPRDGLRLALNRSLSEPGPPAPQPPLLPPPSTPPPSCAKRCKLESVSLPASPCADSVTLQRSLVMKKVRVLAPDALAEKLRQQREETSWGCAPKGFLLVDCRPFMAYNVNHVRGAINVNCSDRFNRRRLQLGKATLADLAATRDGKEALRRRAFKEVVVYDDCSTEFERLPVSHPLFLVLTTLVEDNKEPAFLVVPAEPHSPPVWHLLFLVLTTLVEDNKEPAFLVGEYLLNLIVLLCDTCCSWC
ncbi:uncharacterized protein LOC134537239 [Bacillus rossius redtenbacheri]|uniref:uncharacterized protein LOC134537239 n=1 Tax=Bacillus rossius redtenbacheri TaxID=93214 RepID=UPI002FDEC22F